MTDNQETDRAVDAISSIEADKELEHEDADRDDVERRMPKHYLMNFFSAWLCTKRGWKWTLAIFFTAAVGLALVPSIRYKALNAAGVRCSLSVITMDGSTQLALPGVTLADGHVHVVTDSAGHAALHNLRLGKQTITLARPGFATATQHVVLGWGSNPLGSTSLKSVGQQYTITVRDFITSSTLSGATANNEGLVALADKSGKITLTISDNTTEQSIPVTISAPGYANKNISLSGTNLSPVSVLLAPAQKEVYVAKQDGLYGLYSSYVDGAGKQLLLAGTNTETSNISLAVSPDGTQTALVSTRDANYDSGGALLQALTLVNVGDGTPLTLDHGEQILLLGWSGSTVVYEIQTAAGQSPNYNIVSYNYATSSRNQLASGSQFIGATLAAGVVYYGIPATASTTNNGFYAIQPNGSGKQAILSEDVWSVLRSGYADFSVQTDKSWYDYNIGGNAPSPLTNAPNNLGSTAFLDSPDGKLSASVVNGQLRISTIGTGKSSTMGNVSGAAYPLRWLNATDLIYRVTNGSDSSDYVVNVSGGSPKLITSVVDTTSIVGG